MIVQLPLEHIEWIIDHLYDDKQTLCSCSLVNHDWLPGARYHKFWSVTLEQTKGGSRTLAECPIAVEYVQTLCILTPRSTPEDEITLIKIPCLNSVQKLLLSYVSFNDKYDLTNFLFKFPNLTSLSVHGVATSPAQIFRAFIHDHNNRDHPSYPSPPLSGSLTIHAAACM